MGEVHAGVTVWYYYDESGVCGMNIFGSDYYFQKNLFGDIVALYAADGTLAGTYTYDAWGNTAWQHQNGHSVANWNPFRYRGYYQDQETGFYYLNSRYYDPATGRFINADEPSALFINSFSPMGVNLFAYCLNNPVMYTDPSGHIVITTAIIIGLIVGAVIGGTLGGITAYNSAIDKDKEGGDLFWATMLGVGTGMVLGGAVGFVATAGPQFLVGGIAAVFGKAAEDFVAYTMFGAPWGTWEDYAIAFVFGGLIWGWFGSKPSLGGAGLDVLARPFANQLVRIGTGRQNGIERDKYRYDVGIRGASYLTPIPFRLYARGYAKGNWYAKNNEAAGNPGAQYYYAV